MRFRSGAGQEEVARLIREHLEQVAAAVEAMAEGVRALVEGKPAAELAEIALKTHEREGRADDIRRKTELTLVQGALLAGRRRTLLRLVEEEDRVANAAEAVMDYLALQNVKVPELLRPLVLQILQETQRQIQAVKLAIEALVEGKPEAVKLAEEVEYREGRIDALERRCMNRLFAADLPLAEKLLIRDFIEKLVEISDRAEDLSDLVFTSMAARQA